MLECQGKTRSQKEEYIYVFHPFRETPLPSSLVQILKHLNIVEVEIEKPRNSQRKFTSEINLKIGGPKFKSGKLKRSQIFHFVANCISQNIETCAQRVPTGLSEVFTPYRVLPNTSLQSLYK